MFLLFTHFDLFTIFLSNLFYYRLNAFYFPFFNILLCILFKVPIINTKKHKIKQKMKELNCGKCIKGAVYVPIHFFIIYNILTTRCGHKNVQWNKIENKFRAFIPSSFIPFFILLNYYSIDFIFLLIFCRAIVKSAPYYLQTKFHLDSFSVQLMLDYLNNMCERWQQHE
jgi:hypothetical protein